MDEQRRNECVAKDDASLVAESLFEEAERIFNEKGKLTEDILSALHFIHKATFVSALELVDKGAVSRMLASGRSVYQVIGSSGTPYTCLSTSNYCTCPAFTFSVLHKEDHMMCKHQLAVRVSNITGKTRLVSISDRQLADLLSDIE